MRRELLAASSTAAQQDAMDRWSYSEEDPVFVFAQARFASEVEIEEALEGRDCARLREALSGYPKDGPAHDVARVLLRTAKLALPQFEADLERARRAVQGDDVGEWKAVAKMSGEGEIAQLIERAGELLFNFQHERRASGAYQRRAGADGPTRGPQPAGTPDDAVEIPGPHAITAGWKGKTSGFYINHLKILI